MGFLERVPDNDLTSEPSSVPPGVRPAALLSDQETIDDHPEMQTARRLSERSLEVLLHSALEARVEGSVVLRDREGLRHGVWVEQGYVVGAHVAGRFDPLLDVLLRAGTLDPIGHRRCLEALYQCCERSGSVAKTVAGVSASSVCDALRRQLAERFAALQEIAQTRGHDAQFEAGPVPESEWSVRLPLGSLLRQVERLTSAPSAHEPQHHPHDPVQRRALRELAKTLHPDRHPQLDPETRQRLASQLARATAVYHGFG